MCAVMIKVDFVWVMWFAGTKMQASMILQQHTSEHEQQAMEHWYCQWFIDIPIEISMNHTPRSQMPSNCQGGAGMAVSFVLEDWNATNEEESHLHDIHLIGIGDPSVEHVNTCQLSCWQITDICYHYICIRVSLYWQQCPACKYIFNKHTIIYMNIIDPTDRFSMVFHKNLHTRVGGKVYKIGTFCEITIVTAAGCLMQHFF